MAYDPQNHTVAIAYRKMPGFAPGIVRYSESGIISRLSASDIETLARRSGLPPDFHYADDDKGDSLMLSARGNYVDITYNDKRHYVLRTDGKRLRRIYYFIAANETYALGEDAPSDAPALYTMPDERLWRSGIEVVDPTTDRLAIWGHHMLADISAASDIGGLEIPAGLQLTDMRDVGGWLGLALSSPPGWPGSHSVRKASISWSSTYKNPTLAIAAFWQHLSSFPGVVAAYALLKRRLQRSARARARRPRKYQRCGA